ncbi:MAG: patatin-like phospholipase family protein [Burkholderiaceae bacterium]
MRLSISSLRVLAASLFVWLAGCATSPAPDTGLGPQQPPPPPKLALALGGGGARGFAHIGVIKALESQGISVDIVTGTSAGAVVGALYAGGLSGFQLQRIAMETKESQVIDFDVLSRGGWVKGELLERFVNTRLQGRSFDKLTKPLGVVVTDLSTGETVVVQSGNVGQAVRASASVPGIFIPTEIGGRFFVDGGVTMPLPVQAARDMRADFVIAVDIGEQPEGRRPGGSIDVVLQAFTIMGQVISRTQAGQADVLIRPDTRGLSLTSFDTRELAILRGEEAVARVLPELRQKLIERGVSLVPR